MGNDIAIGIDVGGTRTKVGLVTSSGELLDHQAVATDLTGDPGPFLTAVCAIVERYRSELRVKGIGIALCSLINEDHTGASLSVNAPALNQLDLKALFENRFGCPVRVLNDVNAYALAEYRFGAGQGAKRLLCLAAGTGVAIAVVIRGQFVETWGGVAADAARIILDPDADVFCNGNVRGSAEALCGTAHIARLAGRGYDQGWCHRPRCDRRVQRRGRCHRRPDHGPDRRPRRPPACPPQPGLLPAPHPGHGRDRRGRRTPLPFDPRAVRNPDRRLHGRPDLHRDRRSPAGGHSKGALGPEAAVIGAALGLFDL